MCNRFWMEHQLDKLASVYGAVNAAGVMVVGSRIASAPASGSISGGAPSQGGAAVETLSAVAIPTPGEPTAVGDQPVLFEEPREVVTDVYPSYRTAVVRNRDGQREIHSMYWAFIPGWVTDEALSHPDPNKRFPKPNNATGETITSHLLKKSGMFHAAMKSARCVLPVSGWCEYTGAYGNKVANRITINGHDVIHIAGIYAYRKGFPGLSCAMITTAATGEKSKALHHRIPVILTSMEDVDRWLNPDSDPLELTELFKCVPDELLVIEQKPEDQIVRKKKEGGEKLKRKTKKEDSEAPSGLFDSDDFG